MQCHLLDETGLSVMCNCTVGVVSAESFYQFLLR